MGEKTAEQTFRETWIELERLTKPDMIGTTKENEMATYASDTGGGGTFDPVPEGPHPAICDMFVDLGLQEGKGMSAGKIQHKIYIRWQIPGHRISYEKDDVKHEGPMTIGKQFTLSLHEKATLRKFLQGWRGRAFTPEELKKFDVTTIVGKPCLLSVSHAPKDGGGVYANVDSAMAVPGGMTVPPIEGEALIYDADNMGSFEKLRPWLQDLVKAQKLPAEADKANDPDKWRADLSDDSDPPF
jgi:hypothetical protein